MSNLRIAGPTPFYPGVYDALQKEMITHRGKAYEELHKSIVEKLQPFFGTKEHIYLLTSSGTGGMEAAICNLFNPGEKVLAFTIGVFGDRWIRIAKAFNVDVVETRFTMGQPVDIEKATEVFKAHPDAKGVLITHNETSTSILNDVEAFTAKCKALIPNALILVDSISVLGATPMKMDDWGIDFVVTGSQKAWSAPPGLGMIALSKRAYDTMFATKNARFYFDLRLMDKYAQKNQTPVTPAVGSLYGLEAALIVMHKEGVNNIFKRHIELRDKFRSGAKQIGLELLVVDEKYASPSITSIMVPGGIDASAWSALLKSGYDTILSGGKGELQGKILRIAHMGNVTEHDIDITLDALKKSLDELRHSGTKSEGRSDRIPSRDPIAPLQDDK